MKFKIDENLPVEIAELLRVADHDAVTVHDQRRTGAADTQIIEICRQENRALVTLDLDFANVLVYPPGQFPGIIVLRVRRQDKLHVMSVFQMVVPLIGQQPIGQRLWIVEESRVRMWGEGQD
jgi:predicted nuclease of predicted toxin-antitoxin system